MQRGMRPAAADHPDAAINTFVTVCPDVSPVCDTFADPRNHIERKMASKVGQRIAHKFYSLNSLNRL